MPNHISHISKLINFDPSTCIASSKLSESEKQSSSSSKETDDYTELRLPDYEYFSKHEVLPPIGEKPSLVSLEIQEKWEDTSSPACALTPLASQIPQYLLFDGKGNSSKSTRYDFQRFIQSTALDIVGDGSKS